MLYGLLLGGVRGSGRCNGRSFLYVTLERRPSAVAHVKRMRVPERRQQTEPGECSQVSLGETVVRRQRAVRHR